MRTAVDRWLEAADREQLHHYWTKDARGLRKWAFRKKGRWTALYRHLLKYALTPLQAKLWASDWFREVVGYSAGADLNRVHAGKPPRGDRIGPG